jgi:hypothetical protein
VRAELDHHAGKPASISSDEVFGNRKVFFTKAEVIWTWQAPPGDTKEFVWQSGPSAAAAVA